MEHPISIEELLHEEEGSTIDFKREQYNLQSASDHQKSELIKDILAFANAWRRTDAYILTGVEEIKGGRSNPIGVNHDLDDAQLQQLVNGKTQKPVHFTYKTTIVDGVKIGVFRIPTQTRPIYLKKDYGKLKKSVVYIRRGSSTDEASPDEIYRMGQAALIENHEKVNLTFQFYSPKERTPIGTEINLDATVLNIPEEDSIPDYAEEKILSPFGFYIPDPYHERVNSDFYRNLINYYHTTLRSKELSFSLSNHSGTTISDIKVEITVQKQNDKFSFIMEDDLPNTPKPHHSILDIAQPISKQLPQPHNQRLLLHDLGDAFRIEIPFNKVQPKQTVFFPQPIYIVCNESLNLTPKIIIYADNLSTPIESELSIRCIAKRASGRLEDINKLHTQNLLKGSG